MVETNAAVLQSIEHAPAVVKGLHRLGWLLKNIQGGPKRYPGKSTFELYLVHGSGYVPVGYETSWFFGAKKGLLMGHILSKGQRGDLEWGNRFGAEKAGCSYMTSMETRQLAQALKLVTVTAPPRRRVGKRRLGDTLHVEVEGLYRLQDFHKDWRRIIPRLPIDVVHRWVLHLFRALRDHTAIPAPPDHPKIPALFWEALARVVGLPDLYNHMIPIGDTTTTTMCPPLTESYKSAQNLCTSRVSAAPAVRHPPRAVSDDRAPARMLEGLESLEEVFPVTPRQRSACGGT